MTSSFTRAALLAGVLTLGAAAAASAQTPPPQAGDAPRVERHVMIMGGPGGPGMHGPGMGMGGMHGPMDPEKRAQHLRDVLQLRPDQEGALKAFLAAVTPPAPPAPPAEGAPAPHRMDMPRTTPERLAMMDKMMAEHQARFKKRNDAVRAFYGQLSPSQQKAFDALHQGMGARHGGMRMGGHGGPGMDRQMRIIRRGGPETAGAPGGGTMIIGGPDDEDAFEIELGDDADGGDQ